MQCKAASSQVTTSAWTSHSQGIIKKMQGNKGASTRHLKSNHSQSHRSHSRSLLSLAIAGGLFASVAVAHAQAPVAFGC